MKPLTIGIACRKEFESVWDVLCVLRQIHGDFFDIVVVDNAPERGINIESSTVAAGGRYYHRPDLTGTSAPRDAVFRYADTPWVLCCDSHVFFDIGSLDIFKDMGDMFAKDILSGPMVDITGKGISTHWQPNPGGGLWGTWGKDERVNGTEPFEIPMQGLGVFAMRKDAWPGFHPQSRDFGGEEGYVHEKVRRNGGKAICVPSLRWRHRFRPQSGNDFTGTPYPNSPQSHAFNLLVQHRELGIDAIDAIKGHYAFKGITKDAWDKLIAESEVNQPFNAPPTRPKPQNILGVWYSDNSAPESLIRNSLRTVDTARDWAVRYGRHEVYTVASPWNRINFDIDQTLFKGEQKRSHGAIIRAIQQCLAYAEVDNFKPDIVCLLEHDVLYPPDYFVTVANQFGTYPDANVVSNHDYIGLCAGGWQPCKVKDNPMHQLSMRVNYLEKNLNRAWSDFDKKGSCLLEPQGNRKDWVQIDGTPGIGVMPAVHVNHRSGRFTNHGEVCYGIATSKTHPHWGESYRWWPT